MHTMKWRGESLAYTVGFITAAISLVLFLIARSASDNIPDSLHEGAGQDRDP